MRKIYLPSLTVLRMIAWRRRIVALLRVLCGCLCAVDACYRWLAIENARSLSRIAYEPLIIGQAAPGLYATHLFTICVAAVETIIACCLLCGALTNLACALGILLALSGCTTTGALASSLGGSFDLGMMCIFTLTFLGLALGAAGQAYGIDGLLSSRLGRWSFLASSGLAARRFTTPRRFIAGAPRRDHVYTDRELAATPIADRLSLSTAVPFIEPESQTVAVAHAPKKRQRVLFM